MSGTCEITSGNLSILNVSKGDTKLSFDPSRPDDRKRAAAIVTDMLRRGYAILVEVDRRDDKPLYLRIDEFDEDRCEYIIVGLPEDSPLMQHATAEETPKGKHPRKRKESATRARVPAERASSVAVARTAGG